MRNQRPCLILTILAIAVGVAVVVLILSVVLTQQSWVDTAQAIGGIATAGALIFVGSQFFETRKQTSLMQGRAWIGVNEEKNGGISMSPGPDSSQEEKNLLVSFKNYGNAPAKLIKWRAKYNTTSILTAEFMEDLLRSKSELGGELGQYVLPGKTSEILFSQIEALPGGLPKGSSGALNFKGKPWVGIALEYDAYGSKGEYSFILEFKEHPKEFKKMDQGFVR
jgi:ABC-type antimicrobial peptide transport system permease subunit